MPSEVVLARRSTSGKIFGKRSSVDGLRRPRQAGDESVSALRRPVRDDHALDTAQHESHDDRARRASGAEHERGARRHSPARHLLVEIGDETVHIGVVAVQPAVFVEPDRVHRGELPGELRRRVDEAECRLLMRQGDVAAAIAALAKSGDEACQRVARHPFASVAPLDAKLGKPEAVHQGRSRMRNRIADDAGMLHEDGLCGRWPLRKMAVPRSTQPSIPSRRHRGGGRFAVKLRASSPDWERVSDKAMLHQQAEARRAPTEAGQRARAGNPTRPAERR